MSMPRPVEITGGQNFGEPQGRAVRRIFKRMMREVDFVCD
jgi:hypothetical protein